jgi:hypothetical protein
VQNAILQHQKCNFSIQCSHNRAMYVMFYSSNQALKQVSMTKSVRPFAYSMVMRIIGLAWFGLA